MLHWGVGLLADLSMPYKSRNGKRVRVRGHNLIVYQGSNQGLWKRTWWRLWTRTRLGPQWVNSLSPNDWANLPPNKSVVPFPNEQVTLNPNESSGPNPAIEQSCILTSKRSHILMRRAWVTDQSMTLSKASRLAKAKLRAAQAECGFGQNGVYLHYTMDMYNYRCKCGHVHYYLLW